LAADERGWTQISDGKHFVSICVHQRSSAANLVFAFRQLVMHPQGSHCGAAPCAAKAELNAAFFE
jgi:hypothetical protein